MDLAGVVGAEGMGLKYSSGVPAPAAVSSSSLSWSAAAGFGVLEARGVRNIATGVPRLPPLPGVLLLRLSGVNGFCGVTAARTCLPLLPGVAADADGTSSSGGGKLFSFCPTGCCCG